jgi:hypothetical protein
MRLVILAALPLLLVGTAASADSWFAFRDPDGGFTVDLPGTPTVNHDSVQGNDGQPIGMLEYTIDHGASAMVVIVSDMTRFPNADSGAVIDGAVGGAKGSAQTTVSDTISTVDGQVGRDVVLIDKDSNHIEDRIFFVNHKLYQVMTVLPSTPDPDATSQAQRFQASFHFSG